MKRKTLIQKKFVEAVTRIVFKNRFKERIKKIKNFIKGAKTREELKIMVNLDH